MAYGAMAGKTAGDTFDLSDYNQIDSNFQAGVPDIFTTKGDIAVATAANAASRLAVGANDSTLVPDSGEATGLAWQIQPACRVYNDATIDPATSSWVALTFNQETFDTDAMHSTVASTNRITVPANGDGIYIIGGNVRFDASGQGSGAGQYGLQIRVNGATVVAQTYEDRNHDSIDIDVALTAMYHLSATDYVELLVYTDVNIDIVAVTTNSPIFWACWLRRQ